MEDVILPELLSDNLSDVLKIFLIIASVTAMILWEKNCEPKTKLQWTILQMGATTWAIEDKMPNLGPSTGMKGWNKFPLTQQVLEIIEPFFRDSFFEMLSKETNLYYFQNQGKYDSSSKVLKWVNVSVVCATHKKRSETRYICKFRLVPLRKGECFQRYHTLKHY
jgi:hypothetical protein